MKERTNACVVTIVALVAILACAHVTQAQIGAATRSSGGLATVLHSIEGRIRQRNKTVDNIRVRLVRYPQMQPIADTFTRQDGQFVFQRVPTVDYIVETLETDMYQATETSVAVYPTNLNEPRPTTVTVFVDLPLKEGPEKVAPGEVMADVDLNVPKNALKHYHAGMQKLGNGESEKGIAELRAAIDAY